MRLSCARVSCMRTPETCLVEMADAGLVFRCVFEAVGIPIEVRTNSDDILARFRESFERSAEPPRFQFNVFVHSKPVDLELDAPAYYGRDRYASIILGESEFLSFDLVGRSCEAYVSFVVAADRFLWEQRILPVVAGLIGPECGSTPIHAASLCVDGAAVLISGRSGTGKSTLAAALVDQGMSLIADDWSFVTEKNGKIEAHGMAPILKLLPDTLRFFPWLESERPHITMNGELAFEVDARRRNQVAGRKCAPGSVFLLKRGERIAFAKVDPVEVQKRLCADLEPIPQELVRSRENREFCLDALTKLQCFEMEMNSDPAACADELRRFVEAEVRP